MLGFYGLTGSSERIDTEEPTYHDKKCQREKNEPIAMVKLVSWLDAAG